MKNEENKIPNGYLKWTTFTWIMGSVFVFAGFAYAMRVDSSDKQFLNEDKKIQDLTILVNKHIEIQNSNELRVAQSLGRIEQALKIK